jgi:hypothetical protein
VARHCFIVRSSLSAGFKNRPLKNLFTVNGCWAGLQEAGGLREIEVQSVSKMLACGTSLLGSVRKPWKLQFSVESTAIKPGGQDGETV